MRRVSRILVVALALAAVFFVFRPSSRPQPARATAHDHPEVADTVPERPADARGKVLDDTGQGVPGAKVTLYRALPRDVRAIATVVADDAGCLPTALACDGGDGILVIDATGYSLQAHAYDPRQADITIERGADTTCVITDDTGRPLAGALVEMFADKWSSVRLGSAEADPRGVATLRIAGEAWLLIRHPGYAYQRLRVTPWSELPESLTLRTEFTVGGRILDSQGRPLQGASIQMQQDDSEGSGYEMALLAGADGHFLFRGAHDRDARLTAWLPGYRTVLETVRPGDEQVRIVMRRPASASGAVVLPGGGPASDVTVRTRYAVASTDPAGRFRLEGLAPIAQEIRAFGEGDLEASAEIDPKEGEGITGVRLVLREAPSSFVRVRVSDHSGQVVTEAPVYGETERGIAAVARTGPTGTATLTTRDPPGTELRVEAHAPPEHAPLLCDGTVRAVTSATPDKAAVVEIVLHAPVLVRLDARGPDGGSPEDVWVQFGGTLFFDESAGGWWLNPLGEYRVMIGAPGYLQQTLEAWRPRDSMNVLHVTLQPAAAIRGRIVVDRATTPHRIHVASTSGWHADIQCEPDGTFQIDGMGFRRQILTIGRTCGTPEARIEVTTRSGEVTDLGTIVLVPGVVLTGRIVDSGGDPVGGARIELRTELLVESESTHSRVDGRFRIDASAFADSTLVIRRQGLGAIRAAVPPGGSRAVGDLVMPSPGAVQIEVEGLASRETKSKFMSLWWADEPVALVVDWSEPSDAPPYRNADLAPGRYVARLWVGGDVFEQGFAVATGQTSDVTFRVAR